MNMGDVISSAVGTRAATEGRSEGLVSSLRFTVESHGLRLSGAQVGRGSCPYSSLYIIPKNNLQYPFTHSLLSAREPKPKGLKP